MSGLTRTVWKFPLRAGVDRDSKPFDDIRMPAGARILSAGVIHDIGYVWAELDPYAPLTVRRIFLIGTGRQVPEGRYVGSILRGEYVWHIYDGGFSAFLRSPAPDLDAADLPHPPPTDRNLRPATNSEIRDVEALQDAAREGGMEMEP